MATPCLILKKSQTATPLDVTNYVAEGGLQIEHEFIDADGAGRDQETGLMERKLITHKHSLTVKFRRMDSRAVERLETVINSNATLFAKYWSPCKNQLDEKEFYCSSINFGAQRYDRRTQEIFYDGATIKLIEM